MEKIRVETKEGVFEEKVYNVKDVPLEQLEAPLFLKKNYDKPDVKYFNSVLTFDIETTTIIPETYIKNKDGQPPYGFMYHWQMCLNGVVVFGRYWHEFRYLLYIIEKEFKLSETRRMIIFVHFLSFEFQFINQIIPIDEIFATEKRKILTMRSGGFEFRCSYRLSNKSLEKFCEDSKNCIHMKITPKILEKLQQENPNYNGYELDLKGFDYKKFRTPTTVLTEREKGYCFNDVMGLYECILDFLEDDNLATLPLTSTGFVRRDVRKYCQEHSYRKMFQEMVINEAQYKLLRELFRGGNCHANAFFTGKILKNIKSKDKQSSYPAAIANGLFPMGRLTKVYITGGKEFYKYLKKYCCIFRVCFKNIRLKCFNPFPYIDLGHVKRRKNITLDNGRVVDADLLEIALTEIDWEIIDNQYEFDEFVVTEMYVARKRPLPKEIKIPMMEYFYNKCTLKNIEGEEYNYVKSKNKLNAFYGMMVTAIAHIIYSYIVNTCEWDEKEEDVKEELSKFFDSRSNFLAYQWGVYVTAISRRELQYGLDIVKNDGVYTDTDSVKYIDPDGKYEKEFEKLNKRIIKQCKEGEVPGYVDYNGKSYYLGVWETEKEAELFKTLGAKKYCGVYDGKLKITVSGMNKEKGAKEVGTIENFKLGETYHNVGRTVSFYNDCKKHYINVNGEKFLTASNIGVVDTTYTLGVTSEYWEYFNKIQIEGIAKYDD